MKLSKLKTKAIKLAGYLTYCRDANRVRSQWFTYYHILKPHLDWKDRPYSNEAPETKEANSVVVNRTVWIYWAQGEDKAPKIVRKCMDSIRKHVLDYQVVILRKEDIPKYVSMPDFIMEKYNRGIITQTQFSDLLRIQLLITYGGIWCDATCFMSQQLPDFIDKTPFFMFSKTMLREHISPIVGSSWFIKANQHNALLCKLRNFLFEYWNRKSYLANYFIFHLALGLLVREDEECKGVFDQMLYICNAQPHVLLYSFQKPYSPEFMDFLKNSCFIHKLSYKYDKKLEDNPDNVLMHFLNED